MIIKCFKLTYTKRDYSFILDKFSILIQKSVWIKLQGILKIFWIFHYETEINQNQGSLKQYFKAGFSEKNYFSCRFYIGLGINCKMVEILEVIIVEMFRNKEKTFSGIIIKRRINEILILRKRIHI